MYINEYFKTPIWTEEKPEFVKSLNKASDKYIKAAKKMPEVKKYLKQFGDFGTSHHSTPLTNDNDFIDLRNYIGQKSWEFLDHHGYDMKQYQTMFSEMWVQEFSKKGGGHHSAHIHWNQHVSGFYFLKCSDKTSYPIFHDPRAGARMDQTVAVQHVPIYPPSCTGDFCTPSNISRHASDPSSSTRTRLTPGRNTGNRLVQNSSHICLV